VEAFLIRSGAFFWIVILLLAFFWAARPLLESKLPPAVQELDNRLQAAEAHALAKGYLKAEINVDTASPVGDSLRLDDAKKLLDIEICYAQSKGWALAYYNDGAVLAPYCRLEKQIMSEKLAFRQFQSVVKIPCPTPIPTPEHLGFTGAELQAMHDHSIP
jgi:hypothetical protein